MRTIRRNTDAGLQIVERPMDGSWLDVINPDQDEVRKLSQEYGIPEGFLTPILKFDSIPRTEKSEGVLLILVRVPHFQGLTSNIPYVTMPLGIIITAQVVLTICSHKHDLLQDFPEEHRSDISPAKPIRFVLGLLWSVANSYLRYLGEIDQVVNSLESRLQRSLENKEVLDLLRYQKSLVYFSTGLRTTIYMFERLERNHFLKVKSPDEDLLDDVVTEYREAMEMVGIQGDILSQMMDSFASIIANNLNVVLKFMAAITVILMIPSTIAAFYGMNIQLPLEDSPLAFTILTALSLVISILIGLIFWKKGWL